MHVCAYTWNDVKMEVFEQRNEHRTEQNVHFLLAATVYALYMSLLNRYGSIEST